MINFEGLLRKYKLSLLFNNKVIFGKVESELIEYLNFRCESYYKNFITGSDTNIHKFITFRKCFDILRDNNINSQDNQLLIIDTIEEWYNYYNREL